MARAVRHKYSRRVNGRNVSFTCKNWYVKFHDPRVGRTVKKPTPYSDRKLAERHGHKLQLQAEQAHAGLVVDLPATPDTSIDRLIDEFKGHLESREVGQRQIAEVIAQLRKLCAGRVYFLGEFTAPVVEAFLTKQRRAGWAAQTRNHCVRRAKQFTRWLVKTKRLREDPLSDMKMIRVDADRRYVRRAMSPAEFADLFNTTWKSKVIRSGLDGRTRAILYLVAVCTGLRRLELSRMTVDSVLFDPPRVIVEAAYSKRRRRDVVPLPPDAAKHLRKFVARRRGQERLFKPNYEPKDGVKIINWARCSAVNLAADLEAAKLPVRDERGRVSDLHSLRVSCITELIRQGAPLVTVQKYARHSDPSLTANVYTDTTSDDLVGAAKLVRFGKK